MNTRTTLYNRLLESVLGLKNALVQAAQLSHSSIPFAQKAALFIIAKHQTMTVKQLAEGLHISSGAVTQQLDGLVEAGLVARQAGSVDRRSVSVSLSAKGLDVVEALRKERLELLATWFDDTSDKDLELLADTLERLQTKVKTLR
jgi:DNA-binding MarR family transcriptional regulator